MQPAGHAAVAHYVRQAACNIPLDRFQSRTCQLYLHGRGSGDDVCGVATRHAELAVADDPSAQAQHRCLSSADASPPHTTYLAICRRTSGRRPR